MRKFAAFITVAALAITPSTSLAKGFGGGGFKSSGGGSKSFGGSKPSSSSKSSSCCSSKPAYSKVKPTIAKPSTGPKQQPRPVQKLLPTAPPRPPSLSRAPSGSRLGTVGRYRVPAGRNFGRDRAFLSSHPAYINPYVGTYYGAFDSPFFYMWLFSVTDNDHGNDPVLPQSDEGHLNPIFPSEFEVIGAVEEEVRAK